LLIHVPDSYAALVTHAGSLCPAISPALLAAQIEQESGWQPDAVSSAGAVGIAQFMPGTWRAVGRDYDGDGSADATNPADAIPAQGRYMCDLSNQVQAAIAAGKVHGDPTRLTLAAYNAGFGAVLDAHGMPAFPETQAYVATIVAHLDKYTDSSGINTSGAGAGAVTWPVPVSVIDSDNYGVAGSHWASGHHTGDDFPAPCGTPAFAVTAGVVDLRTDQPWAGAALVTVTAGDGTQTWYAHLQRIDVTPGQSVAAGSSVGAVGDLGNAYGCHLHLEVHSASGTLLDPHDWLAQHGAGP
jgi:murein DD-endopeptidase MepM/ murein hydrolase activator NlpD